MVYIANTRERGCAKQHNPATVEGWAFQEEGAAGTKAFLVVGKHTE